MKRSIRRAASSPTGLRVAVVALLGVVVFSDVTGSWRSVQVPVPVATRSAKTIEVEAVPTQPVTSLAPILDAPLFSSSRQPWTPPPLPAIAPARPPSPPVPVWSGYVLEGIVVSARGRSALIRLPNGNRTVRLHQGDRLDGWVLKEIGLRSLRFVAVGTTRDLSFFNVKTSSPAMTFANARGLQVR